VSINYQPPSLIGATNAYVEANPFLPPKEMARAPGSIMKYEYKSLKPKKQLKEIVAVLKPERKTFLKIPYKFAFNVKDRCVVCGTQKRWNPSDATRPPIPLHKVRKGYPMRGTYCDKHAHIHRQYEMLEQQILAEEHGLTFSAYVPSIKSLNPISSGPLTTLKQQDIQNLSALGWTIKPPQMNTESKEEELFRLIVENDGVTQRIKKLLIEGTTIKDITEEDEWGG
jgi:hypothetical protein|tara:strand:+ start:2251 stop:2928 length:678 start_codon:yes stop_codon:yes gene_type:complete